MKRIFSKLFISNYHIPNNFYTLRKLFLIHTLISVTVVMLVLFAILSYINLEASYISLFYLGSALTLTLILIDLRINKNINRAVTLVTGIIFIFFFIFVYIKHANDYTLLWTIFFPILVLSTFNQIKSILIVTTFYVLLSSYLYYGVYFWMDSSWNLISFLRFITISFILTTIMFINEIILKRSLVKEKIAMKKLKKLAITDDLTQLYNRREITKILNREIYRASRYHGNLSIILFDIDNFKEVNDTYGHNVGDIVLKKTAKLLNNSIRQTDYIGRWGGEEFLLICTESDLHDTICFSEKIKDLIFFNPLDAVGNITCSFGVTQYTYGLDQNSFVANADKALYQAKETGKNKVLSY